MLVICPRCDARVLPMRDGRCPACREQLPADLVPPVPVQPAAAPAPRRSAGRPPAPPVRTEREPPLDPPADTAKRTLGRRNTIRALLGAMVGVALFHRFTGNTPSGSAVAIFDTAVLLLGSLGILATYVWPKRK